MVNHIRRDNPALQSDRRLEFHPVDNDQLICFSKRTEDADNIILVVLNLDPHRIQSGFINLPLDLLKMEEKVPYQAHDLLTGARYLWTGPRNYVELNPASVPAHIFRLRRRIRAENDFEYFI
jgi:starch synthase (maltosyl-transferring)